MYQLDQVWSISTFRPSMYQVPAFHTLGSMHQVPGHIVDLVWWWWFIADDENDDVDDDDDNGHQGSVRPDQTSQDKKRQKQNKGKDKDEGKDGDKDKYKDNEW